MFSEEKQPDTQNTISNINKRELKVDNEDVIIYVR